MAKPLEYNATITQRIDLEPTLSVFRVEPDAPFTTSSEPWFVPGQYLTLGRNRPPGVQDDPRPASVRRPMSIASAPHDLRDAEFYIRQVGTPESDLPLTHELWNISVGDRMYVRPTPAGKFTLQDTCGVDDSRLKVTVAAGTGLAPFLCMVRARVRDDAGADLSDFAVVHGASYPTGLGYRGELEGLAHSNGLKYIPTVSRPKEAPEWTGSTGRAEAQFSEANLGKTEAALGLEEGGLTPERAVVLICGLQGTIGVTIEALLARGFVPDHRRLRRALEVPDDVPASVYWEQYDSTPVIDTKDDALMERLRRSLHDALSRR
ncbi:MAG: hypothetical protein ACE37F_27400 [Nannocystaceae bacterium]|nr:hypothetical protein [bacterium]